MKKSPSTRRQLRVLDDSLHDLTVQLRRESSAEAAKKLLRIKNYAIRAFVSMST
jgi:hypothetical protein